MYMPTGNLIVVLRTATGALPINSGSITVTNMQNETVFYEFLTAVNSGISRTATLEAPPKSISLDSDIGTALPYSLYNVIIRAEGSFKTEIDGVQLFDGIDTHLPIQLIPLPEGVTDPDDERTIVIQIPEHVLRTDGPSSGVAPTVSQKVNQDAVPAIIIGEGVYIPETITVHLGAPDESAQNVTLPFTDYIKNVASSEIYPTWPRESLRANVTAQISLALNRIYTEWYRSRGYDFDITNSTAFDQAFVYGRNIFDEISDVVDEIFNQYIVRPNTVSPLFASYCNGTTSTCAGLSQWGTVALANDGQTSEGILGFYYGDINIAETNDIRTPEESYPGAPLTLGAQGEDVRIIQEQLNRIAINFPQLPLIAVNGVYDSSTQETVREFQRLFILPINGTVDRATWYRISQIYTSVKRLGELTSEGQRAAYNQQLYPGSPIKLYSRGSEVQEIQFYLQRISRFNPAVQSPTLDGIFGGDTQRAVISFQNAYRLEPTGIVDERTWTDIVSIYNGTLDNVQEPESSLNTIPYPGYVISVGSRGEYPRYIQETLNVINNVFLTIPELVTDGIYGTKTQNAVTEFANIFGYNATNGIENALWNKINEINLTVARGCIFSSTKSEGVRDFAGTTLTIGSSGDNVRYIQERINRIHSAIPYIAKLSVDGLYGSATARSVSALQKVFGLTDTGTVNESTWLLINYIVSAIESGCLPLSVKTASAFAEPTPDGFGQVKVAGLKELMKQNGINVGNGPMFGLKTRKALAEWQLNQGLEPTGLPDGKTRKKLVENCKNKR